MSEATETGNETIVSGRAITRVKDFTGIMMVRMLKVDAEAKLKIRHRLRRTDRIKRIILI